MTSNYYLGITIFLTSLTFLLILRFLFFKNIKKLVRKTDDLKEKIVFKFLKSIKLPSIIWILLISLQITFDFFSLPIEKSDSITKIIKILLVFSVTIFVAKFLNETIKIYFQIKGIKESNLITITIYAISYTSGFLIILSLLGISILPILTTLGVGGLAVGLALKDTLSNIFAGLHILVEKNVQIGDYIELEDGKNGYIEDISWRTTKIKTISNNIIIIPNEKLSQSIIINYAKPIENTRTKIEIPISYNSDIDKFEKVVMEEVYNFSQENDKLILDPPPTLRFIPGFGDSSLNFTLFVTVCHFEDSFLIQSELRKRIFKRLKKEGIEIPYPQLDLHIKEIKRR